MLTFGYGWLQKIQKLKVSNHLDPDPLHIVLEATRRDPAVKSVNSKISNY